MRGRVEFDSAWGDGPMTPSVAEGDDVVHAVSSEVRPGVKVAYLVLVHSDPQHFARLLDRLDDPRIVFVVHVDAKADANAFQQAAKGRANVVFVRGRVRVMWAAYSMVEAMLRLVETGLSVTGPSCSHFVVLSGADYPVASNDRIIARLAANPDRQFIRRFDMLKSGDARQIWRVRGYHFRELADRHTFWRKPLFGIEMLLKAKPRRLPQNLVLTSGSQWFAITRAFAEFCATFARANPAFTALFRTMFAPDEIFFHTLLDNSPFAAQAAPIEPYLNVTELGGPWLYGNLHFLNAIEPIRTADEARRILDENSDVLFARKFNSTESRAALDAIDHWIDADTGHRQARA